MHLSFFRKQFTRKRIRRSLNQRGYKFGKQYFLQIFHLFFGCKQFGLVRLQNPLMFFRTLFLIKASSSGCKPTLTNTNLKKIQKHVFLFVIFMYERTIRHDNGISGWGFPLQPPHSPSDASLAEHTQRDRPTTHTT